MAVRTGFSQMADGTYSRELDRAGPYAFDGQNMVLMGSGMSAGQELASNGTYIDVSGSTLYTYNADGTVATAVITQNTLTYTKTYTYTTGNLTAVSLWVPAPPFSDF